MKRVGVVIVTYNRLDFLKDLIASIRNQAYANYTIICINNSSTDGTQEWLAAQSDIITITQENCGGAGGFFTGLKYVAEHEFDYAWVMDDDVVVKEDSLSKLMDRADDCAGFLCSKVVDKDGNPCNIPGIYTKTQLNGYQLWDEKVEKNLIRLSTATFVSVLIPVKVIQEIGLPYKEFFIWGDDTEYTRRISETYPSYLCGNSVVEHRRIISGPPSIFTEKDKKRMQNFYYFYRNTLFYEKKYGNTFQILYRYKWAFLHFIKAMIKFKFSAEKLILKSIAASFFFRPKVVYPNTIKIDKEVVLKTKEGNHCEIEMMGGGTT